MEQRFKNDDNPLKIAIVVDMWLTGFDVPSLSTMYVFKPMKGYNLMQAIARVNRVCRGKEGGLVVDYIGIARALIMNPKLIIADECISALDVSIQAQVVNLMKDIQQETGTAYLFIAHDLSMVKYISDRIGVLHLGHLLETGTTEEIFADPIHPYTRSLLSAIPLPNPVVEKRRVAETYDYATSGIDYSKGTSHLVSGSHYVKCTDEEFAKWRK